VGREGFEPPKA